MTLKRFATMALFLLVSVWTMPGSAQVNVTTYHNDNSRTGQNLQETSLTTSNVNSTKFGKLFSQSLDGYTYAQPLYVSNLTIKQGTHNVVYVATMNDTVYAFDADSNTGSNAQPLWKVNFTNAAKGITTVPTSNLHCDDVFSSSVGIFSTPVIDTASKTIYVLARTLESGAYFHRLHALDITTGAEKFGGPVAITASAPGSGSGSKGGTITFDPKLENQRAALLLMNGQVYISWASLCDYSQYHGWVISYDAKTLAQTAIWLITPNGKQGGVWQSGDGPAGDDNNNAFVAIGNGTFDVNVGGIDYGQSIVKIGPPASGIFPVVDYFTPSDAITDNDTDLDIGSTGLVLLPDQTRGPHEHLLVQGDKAGNLYLINRDDMGDYDANNNNQIVQYIKAPTKGLWSSPSWWNNFVYVGGQANQLKAFSFNTTTGLLSTTPSSKTTANFGYPGTTVSISSNGTSNGIVWALNNSQYKNTSGQASLHAYKATNLASQIYTSNTNATRDNPGAPIKFTVPTVANGKVYITTQKNLAVYGLLN